MIVGMGVPVHLSAELRTLLERWAHAGYPQETCGLLIGERGQEGMAIQRVVQARNLNRERAQDPTEVLSQLAACTGEVPDAFVAGVGTGGTLTGVGRRLREVSPEVHIVAAIPESFPGIEGLKPLGDPGDIVPSLLDPSLIDEHIAVSLDEAVACCRRLVHEGLFVGPSSGAFVHAALKLAATRNYRTIVTVLSDTGERYLSTGMWKTQNR